MPFLFFLVKRGFFNDNFINVFDEITAGMTQNKSQGWSK